MSLLRRALRSVVTIPDNRAQLRAAKIALSQAQRAVEVASAGTERVYQLARDATAAEIAAVDAEKAFAESIRKWAAAGAPGNTKGDPILDKSAQTARATATRLRLLANAASDSLQSRRWDWNFRVDRPITPAEITAREDLQSAEEKVHQAVWPLVMSEVEPDLKRATELYSELNDLLPRLYGFRRLVKQNIRWVTAPSNFSARFDQMKLPKFEDQNEQRLLDLMMPWSKFGDKLIEDSESKFDAP